MSWNDFYPEVFIELQVLMENLTEPLQIYDDNVLLNREGRTLNLT